MMLAKFSIRGLVDLRRRGGGKNEEQGKSGKMLSAQGGDAILDFDL